MLRLLIIQACCLLFCITVRAQQAETTELAEPEFINQFYNISDSNKLVLIEKGEVFMKTKSRLGGFGGSSTVYIMTGSAARVHIGNHQPAFAIKLEGMLMTEPLEMMQLFKFEKKGKNREVVLSKSGLRGKGMPDEAPGIRCNVKKTASGTYLFYPAQKLEPGEYGFINRVTPVNRGTQIVFTVFAFAVD